MMRTPVRVRRATSTSRPRVVASVIRGINATITERKKTVPPTAEITRYAYWEIVIAPDGKNDTICCSTSRVSGFTAAPASGRTQRTPASRTDASLSASVAT